MATQRTKSQSAGDTLATAGVRHLLEALGENPDSEALIGTPARVVRAFREMTAGNRVDVESLFRTQFNGPTDEVIALKGIQFTSLCEHHLLPFVGEAHVAYLPRRAVVGLSKLARVVQAFAQRLQLQERLTAQVAWAIMQNADARGAVCIIRAKHSCMGCRGARQPHAEMVTSSILGVFRKDAAARNEVLALLR